MTRIAVKLHCMICGRENFYTVPDNSTLRDCNSDKYGYRAGCIEDNGKEWILRCYGCDSRKLVLKKENAA